MDIKTRPELITDEDIHVLRMRALLEHVPLAMAFVRQRRFEIASEHMSHLFGYDDGSALAGRDTRAAHVSDAANAMLLDRMSTAFVGGHPFHDEVEYVRHDGSRFWGSLHATPVQWDAPGDSALWVIEDVTAARALRMQPSWRGRHDPVTELAHRREFQRRLADHVGSQRRTPVSLLWLDIDHFGEVSARMGDDACDHFLYLLGRLLVAKVRASDIVARVDAHQFAVLLPECDQHHALSVAEKLRASVAGHRLRWGLQSTKLKACVGVVQLHRSLDTVEAALDAASHACGLAQAAGGDCVRVFVPQASGDTQMSMLD